VPPVSVALKVGIVPETPLDCASRSVIVTVEVADPLATTFVVPVIVEVDAEMAPATKLTVPSGLLIGELIESVLVPTRVEVKVQVEIPVVGLELVHVP
jgi:hypothetical protein